MTASRRSFLAGAAALAVAPVAPVALTVPPPSVPAVDLDRLGRALSAATSMPAWLLLPGPVLFRRPATDTEPEETDAELRERAHALLGG